MTAGATFAASCSTRARGSCADTTALMRITTGRIIRGGVMLASQGSSGGFNAGTAWSDGPTGAHPRPLVTAWGRRVQRAWLGRPDSVSHPAITVHELLLRSPRRRVKLGTTADLPELATELLV